MKHSQVSQALVFKFNSERGSAMQVFHQCDVRGSGEALPCAFAQFALLPY